MEKIAAVATVFHGTKYENPNAYGFLSLFYEASPIAYIM
jgi:hypothetical protein